MENDTSTTNIIKPFRNRTNILNTFFREDNRWEIGVDEAGRGPLFGRLYVAATILPKTGFQHEWMKDSKRFSSQKKIREVSEYIKSNAVAWTVRYAEAELIDEINIRQAVLRTMRECCRDLIEKIQSDCGVTTTEIRKCLCLLIDGNDFPAYTIFDPLSETLQEIESRTIEGGDNLYTCIAAASILAKVARDDYIDELCKQYPLLSTNYGIGKNKGYGTAEHMRGIREYGITKWHRKSYGPCKTAPLVEYPASSGIIPERGTNVGIG
jgi:ribonuclease HII